MSFDNNNDGIHAYLNQEAERSKPGEHKITDLYGSGAKGKPDEFYLRQ